MVITRISFLLLLAGCCLAPVNLWALRADDLLFYAPLDGTLDARAAKGAAKPARVDGEVKFVAGRTGQGLLVGGSGAVCYATAGNVELDAGAIAIWVKPVDWQTGEPAANYTRLFVALSEAPFVMEKGAGNFAWLYKYSSESVYWLVQQSEPFTQVFITGATFQDLGGHVLRWEKGKWVHLLATWSGDQLALYINGQFASQAYVPTARILRKFADTFQVGGQNMRGTKGTPDTVLNDLLILRSPVTPAEARLIYERGVQAFAPPIVPTPPLVKFRSAYVLSATSARLDLALVGVRPDAVRDWTCDYEIENAASPTNRLAGQFALTAMRTRQECNLATLPDGTYRTRVHLKLDGHEVASAESRFEKLPAPSWLGNTVGIETNVPAPWTPMKRRNNTLSCWGRTYAWGDDALPAQITSQDEQLLDRPVTLHAKIGGRDVGLRSSRLIWNRVASDRAEFTAVAALDEVPVFIRGSLEYDGFAWLDIELQGDDFARNRTVDALCLEVPLRRAAAPLMHLRAPAESGKTMPFHGKLTCPEFWFGNERGGLQIATRDWRDWRLNDRENMVSLSTNENEAVFRFSLIDHPTRLTRSLRYTLGLQATPVKPMPKGWRAWEIEFQGLGEPTKWMIWWQQWARQGDNSVGPYGYPVASEHTLAELADWHKKGYLPWIYWLVDAIWLGDPVVKAMGGEWAGQAYGGDFEASNWLPAAKPMEALQVNHDLASVRDYQVWSHYKLFKDNPQLAAGIQGLYLDMGAGYWRTHLSQDSTTTEYAWTILGARDLQKRFYRMIKKDWPHLLLASHITGDPHSMSMYAFTDLVISGEHLQPPALLHEHNYHHVLNLDLLRAEYYGPKFGVPAIFLSEDGQTGPEGFAASEHLCGLLWAHDVIPWAANFNPIPFFVAARVKKEFGWDDETRFRGYWENSRLVRLKADQSSVVASSFTRKGQALFVVMNDSDAEAHVRIAPDWPGLGVHAPARLIDVYAEMGGRFPHELEIGADGQWKPFLPKAKSDDTSAFNVPVKTGAAEFIVKARNFRILAAR